MARKKQTLKISHEIDVTLIGISCHLRSYQLSFAINKELGFNFRRIDDFLLPDGTTGNTLEFPFMLHEDADLKTHFCLIANHHPQGKLIPAIGQVDYFLLATEPLESGILDTVITKIRNIPQVLAAYRIDPSKVRDFGTLLAEMELHLLSSARKQGRP